MADPKIDRREVLRGVIALVGGAGSVVSCSGARAEPDPFSAELQYFDRVQMQTLACVVDVVIPEAETPGALGARVHHFIDGMMAEWASAETRAKYSEVLRQVDTRAVEAFGAPFGDCSPGAQEALVRRFDAGAYGTEPSFAGFADLKELIVAGYYSSEIGASRELQYERVPGRYVPCAPLADIGRAWAHR